MIAMGEWFKLARQAVDDLAEIRRLLHELLHTARGDK